MRFSSTQNLTFLSLFFLPEVLSAHGFDFRPLIHIFYLSIIGSAIISYIVIRDQIREESNMSKAKRILLALLLGLLSFIFTALLIFFLSYLLVMTINFYL